jgi:hypothetical protein
MRNTLKDRTPRCNGISDYICRHDPDPARAALEEWARLADGSPSTSYHFNSVGAFSEENDFDGTPGDSYMLRPPPYGAGAPYSVVLDVGPRADDRALKDATGSLLKAGFSGQLIGDPFNPAFVKDLESLATSAVAPRAADPRLQMWFAGNEIGIFDVAGHRQHGAPAGQPAGVRDLRRWIWSDIPAGSSVDQPGCARHALAAFLRGRYATIDALNTAWQSRYADWEAIVVGPAARPVPSAPGCNAPCGEDLQRFVHDLLVPAWVHAVTTSVRKVDSNHLIASPRLAIASEHDYRFWRSRGAQPSDADHWADEPAATVPDDHGDVRYCPFDALGGNDGFDLIAINTYCGDPTFAEPWFTAGLEKMRAAAGVPVLISEFGIRARIPGWNDEGGAPSFVPSPDPAEAQRERGRNYATQVDQFVGLPFVVGACWHAWSDRFNHGEDQINMGLVQCTDPGRHDMLAGQRWEDAYPPIAQTNRTILDAIHHRTGF